jgi:hypothetical protein
MNKRQEKPYAAHVAALSKPKLIAEIGGLLQASLSDDASVEDKITICIAEDDRRGGTCYPKAVEQFNQALGYREVAPGQFDLRETR